LDVASNTAAEATIADARTAEMQVMEGMIKVLLEPIYRRKIDSTS
jgi:hypothetical protein